MRFDNRGAAGRDAAAFREVGIDRARMAPEVAAEQITARPQVLAAVIPALTDWAACQSDSGDDAGAEPILAVAAIADPDPWRQHVRQALQAQDETALVALAAKPGLARQPAATLTALGTSLRVFGRT